MSDLERELETELHRVLDPLAALPIPARRQAPGRTGIRALVGGAGAALTFKLLTGVAAAAAAVTITGAAATGSLNPADWGQQVAEQVASCKAKLASGQHGIGDCVSSFASQHGSAVASAARQHGHGNDGNGNANGNANGNSSSGGHGKDKAKDQTVPPRSVPPTAPESQREPTDPAGTHPPAVISPLP